MTTKSRTDQELWGAVQALDLDLLDPATPTEVVDAAAKTMGLDSCLAPAGRACASATALLDGEEATRMDAEGAPGYQVDARASTTDHGLRLHGQADVARRVSAEADPSDNRREGLTCFPEPET